MSKNKKKTNFKIKADDKSGLSSFVQRPVPTEKEVNNFEEVIGKEIRQQEIDANLNEIYSDKKGKLVDVKQLNIKKKQAVVVRILARLIYLVALVGIAYWAYQYFFAPSDKPASVNFSIEASEQLRAGEEFSYFVKIDNQSKQTLKQVNLEFIYPESFILLDSELEPQEFSNSFLVPDILPKEERLVEVRGMIIAKPQSVAVVSAHISYIPSNFSSIFKKEASTVTEVLSPKLSLVADYPSLVFIGQSNDIELRFSDYESASIRDFILEFNLAKDASITLAESNDSNDNASLSNQGQSSWAVNLDELVTNKLKFKYLAKEASDNYLPSLRLRKRLDDGQSYLFYEDSLNINAIASNLNLSLEQNGSKSDQVLSFGDELNYTISYSNKSEQSYTNASIAVVLEGKLFDFSTLSGSNLGEIRSNQIIWDKSQISQLANLKSGDEGEVSFSIKLKNYNANLTSADLELASYARYGLEADVNLDNKSNKIVNQLNSNLSLNEQVRYFDENNLPVGLGPLPPEVGEETQYRVYWQISNSLHDLKNTKVELELPAYINYVEAKQASVGAVNYDGDNHLVSWDLGRLPATINSAQASFVISLIPGLSDKNKILVLIPGATITAFDEETKEEMSAKSGPKTTKLEDDDIAALTNTGKIE